MLTGGERGEGEGRDRRRGEGRGGGRQGLRRVGVSQWWMVVLDVLERDVVSRFREAK